MSEQSGAEEACWAHNPEVRGSKPRSARIFFFSNLLQFFFQFLFFFILYFSHFFIFIFIIQEDLSEAELNRLDTVFKKLYLEKYPKVGYVEGHEPNHEDNLTMRKNKNIELWVVNVQF